MIINLGYSIVENLALVYQLNARAKPNLVFFVSLYLARPVCQSWFFVFFYCTALLHGSLFCSKFRLYTS